MKIKHPYKCDGCLRLKGENESRWYLCLAKVVDPVTGDPEYIDGFALIPWDDKRSDDPDVLQHLCSADCCMKSLGKWLSVKDLVFKELLSSPVAEEMLRGELTSR